MKWVVRLADGKARGPTRSFLGAQGRLQCLAKFEEIKQQGKNLSYLAVQLVSEVFDNEREGCAGMIARDVPNGFAWGKSGFLIETKVLVLTVVSFAKIR